MGFYHAPLKWVSELMLTLEPVLLVFTQCLLLLGLTDSTCSGPGRILFDLFGFGQGPIFETIGYSQWLEVTTPGKVYSGKSKMDLASRLMSLKLLLERTCVSVW